LINTTGGANREVPRGTIEGVEDEATHQRRINTTAIFEPEPIGSMVVEDEEPEVAFIISGANWIAEYSDGTTADVALFCILEDGSCYGVGVNEAGRLDLETSLETTSFVTYKRTSKERK